MSTRENLRNALDGLQAAKDALVAAEQVVNRAQEDLGRATDALEAFAGLDQEFSAVRVAALKAGAWTGYPSELQQKQRERLDAQEDASSAQRAFEILKAEADDARADVVVAERVLQEFSAVAFCAEVETVVKDLEQLNQQRDRLHQVLRGACLPFAVPGFERLAPDQRTNIMASAIRSAGLPVGTLAAWRELDVLASNAVYARPNGEASEDITAYWQTFAKAIATDPDAQPGPLPDPDAVLAAK
jgi:hypothetical protein